MEDLWCCKTRLLFTMRQICSTMSNLLFINVPKLQYVGMSLLVAYLQSVVMSLKASYLKSKEKLNRWVRQ